MTALNLIDSNEPRSYSLVDGSGKSLGTLSTDRRVTKGEIRTAAGVVPVRTRGFRQHTTIAGDERAPILTLDDKAAALPGGVTGRWQARCGRRSYDATLTAPGGVISLAFPGGDQHRTITVRGDWAQPELVALTAAFALLARGRGDMKFTAAAIAIATSGNGGAR